MGDVHQAEYKFPTPQEFINNGEVPESKEVDRLLDEMVNKALDGGLGQLYDTVNWELNSIELFNNGPVLLFDWDYTTQNNIRDYIQNGGNYTINRSINFERDGINKGRGKIHIEFKSNSIILSYGLEIDDVVRVEETSIEIYNISDIAIILNANLNSELGMSI